MKSLRAVTYDSIDNSIDFIRLKTANMQIRNGKDIGKSFNMTQKSKPTITAINIKKQKIERESGAL